MAVPTAVLLIDQNYINQFSHINKSVEWAYIKPSVLDAQNIRIQPVLGTDLFKKILTGTAAGNLTSAYVTLRDEYIMPSVLYWTLHDLIPHLKVKIDNGGLLERVPDNTNSAGANDVDTIRDDYYSKAQFATNRMLDYICDNMDSFPEFSTNDLNQLPSNNRKRGFPFGVVNERTGRVPLNEDPYWRGLIG
jgi:hypothetical protein